MSRCCLNPLKPHSWLKARGLCGRVMLLPYLRPPTLSTFCKDCATLKSAQFGANAYPYLRADTKGGGVSTRQ